MSTEIPRGTIGARPERCGAGAVLPPLHLAVSASNVVAMSMATRDFHPVHHDVEVARAAGHPALFLNIMSTAALVERFVGAWGGPVGRLSSLKLRLGVPHYAGDTLILEGCVTSSGVDDHGDWCEVDFTGRNAQGRHATGQLRVNWPAAQT